MEERRSERRAGDQVDWRLAGGLLCPLLRSRRWQGWGLRSTRPELCFDPALARRMLPPFHSARRPRPPTVAHCLPIAPSSFAEASSDAPWTCARLLAGQWASTGRRNGPQWPADTLSARQRQLSWELSNLGCSPGAFASASGPRLTSWWPAIGAHCFLSCTMLSFVHQERHFSAADPTEAVQSSQPPPSLSNLHAY